MTTLTPMQIHNNYTNKLNSVKQTAVFFWFIPMVILSIIFLLFIWLTDVKDKDGNKLATKDKIFNSVLSVIFAAFIGVISGVAYYTINKPKFIQPNQS